MTWTLETHPDVQSYGLRHVILVPDVLICHVRYERKIAKYLAEKQPDNTRRYLWRRHLKKNRLPRARRPDGRDYLVLRGLQCGDWIDPKREIKKKTVIVDAERFLKVRSVRLSLWGLQYYDNCVLMCCWEFHIRSEPYEVWR